MKAELEQLIALQQTDTEIRKLQAELNAIPQRRAEIETEFDQRASEFKQVESRRDAARDRRSQLERELAEARTRADKAERDRMASTNQKIYEAALREADAARKQISQLETQVLEQMETLEQADKELGEREPEVATLRVEQEQKLREFEERTRAAGERLEQLRAERERLMAALPKQVSTMYNRISMRIRDGVAVAEARNGSCSSCFIALRPQMMAQVRRGDEIVVCDNCNRILYYAAEQAQKAS